MILESVQSLVEQSVVNQQHQVVQHRQVENTRRMSLVDLGKRLLEAAKRGETDTVRALMSNGAPFTTDWLGTSPLHFAAQYGHQDTAEVLLRAGISRDARTKVDRTPLHVASQEGHMAIVQLLLQSNADIDAKDMLKMTPLHWSTEKGHVSIIGILIRNGADITLEDKFNRTPVDIALNNGRTDLAQLLQLHQDTAGVMEEAEGATIDAPDNLVTETVSTSEGVEGLVIDTDKFYTSPVIKSEPDDSTDQSSTSVLATLAALAEATAPHSTSHATTSDAMSWLESQGITMISGDGSLITSAVESGQTITLTEAGKIALNQFIQQEAEIGAVGENGDMGEVTEEVLGQQMTEESIVEHTGGTGLEEHEQGMITIVTGEDVGADGQIIMEESIIHEQDGVSHMTEEDSSQLIIEEAHDGAGTIIEGQVMADGLVEGEEIGESHEVLEGVTEEQLVEAGMTEHLVEGGMTEEQMAGLTGEVVEGEMTEEHLVEEVTEEEQVAEVGVTEEIGEVHTEVTGEEEEGGMTLEEQLAVVTGGAE